MRGQLHAPGRSSPPGKTRYPLCRKLGGAQGRSGQVRKISPPPGFNPRTVQPVASRYTDYATRPTCFQVGLLKTVCSTKFLNALLLHLVSDGIQIWMVHTSRLTKQSRMPARYSITFRQSLIEIKLFLMYYVTIQLQRFPTN